MFYFLLYKERRQGMQDTKQRKNDIVYHYQTTKSLYNEVCTLPERKGKILTTKGKAREKDHLWCISPVPVQFSKVPYMDKACGSHGCM